MVFPDHTHLLFLVKTNPQLYTCAALAKALAIPNNQMYTRVTSAKLNSQLYTWISIATLNMGSPNYTKPPVIHANNHGENKPIVVQQLSHIQVGHDEMNCSLPPIRQTGGAKFDLRLQPSVG